MRRASRDNAVCFESLEKALAESPETYGHIDLVAFGFSCQDISGANPKGKGLKGERSSIFFECIRIVNILNPTWLLIENVPRLLSINEGRDFGIVLQTLAESGYGYSWRILDSQYFGVPQRRKRVFIVGRFGEKCPPEILFEPKGSSRNDSPKPKIRQRGLCLCTPRGRCDPSVETYVASTIQATDYQKTQHGQFGNEGNLIAHPIQATDKKLRKFGFGENLVSQTLGVSPRGNASFVWQDTHIAETNPNRKGKTPRASHKLDSVRGVVIGNAVTVPVAEWIAKRIYNYTKGDPQC